MTKQKSQSKRKEQIAKTKLQNLLSDAAIFYAEVNLPKLRIIRTTTYLVVIIGSAYLLIHQAEIKDFFASILQRWTFLWGILIMAGSTISKFLRITRDRNAARMMADSEYGRRIIVAQIINQMFILGLIAVPIIYISGLTNSVAEYLHTVYPIIEVNVGNAALSILSYIVSGVIGNAAYDFLKVVVINKKKNGKAIKQ